MTTLSKYRVRKMLTENKNDDWYIIEEKYKFLFFTMWKIVWDIDILPFKYPIFFETKHDAVKCIIQLEK